MKETLLRYGAALLLTAVAITQIVRAHALDQSPWRGGGFGMFATIDGWTRFARVVDDEGPRSLPASTDTLVRESLVVLGEDDLSNLATSLAASGVRGPGRLEVWRVRFDATSLRVTPERVAQTELLP